MMLVAEHFRAQMLALLRTPAYSALTIFTPSIIFIFVGLSVIDSRQTANIFLGSYSIFAALGVAFFQFGVGIANERGLPWEQFAHVLPVSPVTRFASRVLAAMVFAAVAIAILIGVALLVTDVDMPSSAWGRMLASVFLGALPMSLLGITIGYWFTPRAALPAANILHLALAFAGGLFIPPEGMPDFLDNISRVLPTRHIGELTWAAVLGNPWPVESWLWLAGYAIVFGILATLGYRRDEGMRYR
jgi:ABC-2 type transport system permease protein